MKMGQLKMLINEYREIDFGAFPYNATERYQKSVLRERDFHDHDHA
jgi:hypothetical protein